MSGVSIPSIAREAFIQATNEAVKSGVRISFILGEPLRSELWFDHQDVDSAQLSSVPKPLAQIVNDAIKRWSDVLGPICLIVLLAPVFLLLGVIIGIKFKGKLFLTQERAGQDGKRFTMIQFRAMEPCDYEGSAGCGKRSRGTAFDSIVNYTCLNRLPQLLNVILGDMSLVGPRPEVPASVEQYTNRQRQTLTVKPGVTGLWQIDRGGCFHVPERIASDLYYVQHRNSFMDCAILLHTAICAISLIRRPSLAPMENH
jgi:lipopolysaccharide/colanic/teichoic acid biosynthesis glycosyltransferase